MNITLRNGPYDNTFVPERGQDQVVMALEDGELIGQGIYERFASHPHEAFWLCNEWLGIKQPD